MSDKTNLFGMQIDPLRMPQAVDQVIAWVEQGERRCRYVVTPNVDHAVMFQENASLRGAYCDASLVLADGALGLLHAVDGAGVCFQPLAAVRMAGFSDFQFWRRALPG